MKPIHLAFLAILASTAFIHSQEKPSIDSPESIAVTAASRTYITDPLEFPEFIPPPPAVPKQAPAMRVESAVMVLTRGSHMLTIIRGEASTLPDLPAPPAAIPTMQRAATPEELEQMKIERRHNLCLGATVFDHRVSLVQWHNPDTGEYYQAACGFDIGLLAGTGGFVHNGESYNLFLVHSDIDTTGMRHAIREFLPDIPEPPADSTIILKGNPKDPAGIAPITVIREIVNIGKPRLIPYQAARLRYQASAAAWEKAHPRVPRDETFWFKPHRGSRYLNAATKGGVR